MRQWRFGVAMVVGLLAATMLAGCAQERDPIDRVQPNAIKKTMLNGEWFFHQKVIDVPGGMLQGFIIPSVVGWYSDPLRVRFDIQEKFLYVRRVNEIVPGAETYSQEYDEEWTSYALLAAYRIEKHFDIQRDYNPVTGESYNVVSENSMDRPWWEREYIRVDWSTNLAPGFNFDVEYVSTTPSPFYVQDSCTPDLEFAADPRDRCVPGSKAPFFDIVWNADGSGLEKGYFDITTAFAATPQTTWYAGYGMIPACWLFENEVMECVPTIYFVRNSFWLNDNEKRDFEPMPAGGDISSQFGYFMSDYLGYSSQQTIIEPSRTYLIQRHNLWEQSHSWNRVDPATGGALGIDWVLPGADLFNPDSRLLCRTTADCCADYDPKDPTAEARCNSICDVYTPLRPSDRRQYEDKFSCKFHVTPQNLSDECAATHYCTLPYNERRVRPMVYYANAEWPEEIARHPMEPQYVPPTADAPGIWSYEVDHEPNAASLEAWKWAMADEPINETRSTLEKVGDRWNAPFVRSVNILKRKAAGVYNPDTDANVPYINDDMRRKEGGQGAFSKVALITAPNDNDDMRGFDENWYDADRPPFAMCRFLPVLGPDNDPNNVEPDICWERIQELSHCVFNPEIPGINPRTGQEWVEAASWPLCTLREATPRLGDIRYSFSYWVDKWYEGFRLLGLGPGHSDLVTGETLAGAAHMYMHNDMYARSIVDKAILLTGDLDVDDYIDGYNLLGWRNRYTGSGTNPQVSKIGGGALAGMGGYSAADIATQAGWMKANFEKSRKFNLSIENISAMGESHMPSHGPVDNPVADLVFPFTADDLFRAAANSLDATGGYLSDDIIRSIADSPEGGYIEEMLLNAQPGQLRTMLAGSGFNPKLEEGDGWTSPEIKDHLLITRRDPFRLAKLQASTQEWLESEFRADFAGPADEVAGAVAYELQRLRAQGRLPKAGDPGYSQDGFINAAWRLVRKKVLHSVTMHEIGHSVGLRHNFAGSQDYLNYFEDYWTIRASGCADVTHDWMAPKLSDMPAELPWNEENGCGSGELGGRVGPRFVDWKDGGDPLSQYEIHKQLHNYSYSSVMDYGSGVVDQAGVGRYEWAALLYGYGHHFEVYKDFPKAGIGAASWKNHPWFRPGYVTGPGSDTRIVESHPNAAINPAALVVNDEGQIPVLIGKTGQRLCVDQSDIGDNYLNLVACNPGEPPCIVESWNEDGTWECMAGGLNVGDKFSVWGWPIRMNTEVITGYTIKDMLDGYLSSGGNPLVFFYSLFYAPHYTQWHKNWPELGFNLQSNREVRDIREFDWRVRSQGNSWRPGFNLRDLGDQVIRVPYAYCTDNGANISNDCRTRDIGADDWERMNFHITEWDQWYISRSFIRQRVGVRPERYPSSFYNRIYRAPKNFNDIYSLYQELLTPLYTDPRQMDALRTDPYNSWGGYTMALHDGFNMLWQTISAPDAMSPYMPKERPENSEFALDADLLLGIEGNYGFDIGNGGRVFETRYGNYNYDNNCGNTFWRCLWNVGYYYDKVMAINAMSESGTFFVGRDTAHDVRLYRVSFFDNFNWQIKKYFAAMMGEDWGTWAPVVAMSRMTNDTEVLESNMPILPTGYKQPKIFHRNWANPTMDITNPWVFLNNKDWGTATGNFDPMELINTGSFNYEFTPIEPVASFTVQVYAMVLGMARFAHNYDFSFYNTARMWQSPSGSPETFGEVVKYFDKENQIVYSGLAEYGVNEVFHPYTTEEETGTGVAAAMIRYANAMKARSTECDATGITPWTDDDCCDNPYYPATPDTSDDCPAITGYTVGNDFSPEEQEEIMILLEEAKERVTKSLKNYKGLLDLQVRLTTIYDRYRGMIGPVYDPGATPGE